MPKVQGGDKEELKNQQVTKEAAVKKVGGSAPAIEKINTSSIVTGNSMRDGIRKKLVDLISAPESSEQRKSQATKVALAIEDQVYNVLKDKSRDYTDKIRSILSNLRDPKNPELRTRLIDGVITPMQVATMDATILASQSLKEERERMARLAVESSRTDYENEKQRQEVKVNSFFECIECKSNKVYPEVINYGTEEDSEKNFLTCL